MKFVAAIFAALFALSVQAAPGLWYEPERDGHGLSISQETEGRYAVIWWLYQRDRAATFLLAHPACTGFPCVTELHQPAADWLGGDLEIGEPVGSIEIHPEGESLRVVFDLRGLDPETCTGISPGGVIFRECAGRLTLTRLAW